jgi:glycosyltransferase involved in cell wall biosynthesis/ribosomal protein S18 acetylase RimI-like enzyme
VGAVVTVHVAHVATVDLTVRFLLLPQLRGLRDHGYDVTAISAPGPWVPEIEAEGFRVVPWMSATRAWHPRADVEAFAELLQIFRRNRFDVVHTHSPKPGVLGRIAARAAHVPCVVNTVHGYWATPQDRAARRIPVVWAERLAACFSDLELFQSAEDLEWGRRAGIVSPRHARLLGNGTDLERFDPVAVDGGQVRDELGLAREAVVVGAMGRLVAEKGYRELFAAARIVREKHPEVRFVVLGAGDPDKVDGLDDAELREAASDVLFADWRSDVPGALAAMDVFALPSWREGMPRSAIEAAAMGKAMVLTDIRGCREVARDGREALLVPPRDPDCLAAAILAVVEDDALRARLGGAARERALQRFDERRVVDRIIESYERVLARRGIRPPGSARGAARIRRATPPDAPLLARLHRESMPTAFLPALGEGFLRELYRAIATEPGGAAFVAEDGPHVIGFVAGASSVREFYGRFYRRHGLRAGIAAAPRLLRPSVLRRFRETVSYPARSADLPDAELLSIAVDDRSREKGLGRRLARALLDDLARRGVEEVKVVVDASNVAANGLYEAVGFRHAREIAVHDGVVSNIWVASCRS